MSAGEDWEQNQQDSRRAWFEGVAEGKELRVLPSSRWSN